MFRRRETQRLLSSALAVASVALGLVWQTPVRAEDAGGDCCADLESSISDLEAATAQKGNSIVSVTVYGWLNRAVLFWDDGHEQNTYVVDNYYAASRFGFKGSAKIGGNWSAGYQLEAESRNAASDRVNQFDDNANDPQGNINVRQSNMYLANKVWGQLRWGLTNTPSYNVAKDTNVSGLEDTMDSDNKMNRSFFLRPRAFSNAEGSSTLKWSDISSCYNAANAFGCWGAAMGLRTGRPIGPASHCRWVSSMTPGEPLCVIKKNWARPLRLVLASATRKFLERVQMPA